MLRFVKPETKVLTLSDNETITVRTRLTHGEYLALWARMFGSSEDGKPKADPYRTGDSLIIAYLVDWSARGLDGAPLSLRGLSGDEIQDLLNGMEQSSVREIKRAIEQHDNEVTSESDDLKKTSGGEAESRATLQSVA